MQTGEYIVDRWMVDIVKEICGRNGIDVKSYSQDWVLTLQKDARKTLVCGFKFGLNSSASSAISQDKVATYQLLDDARIAAVPHILVSTRATKHSEWADGAEKWGQFLAKPTHGMGGRGIYLFDDTIKARDAMEEHAEESWCVAPFLPIIKETRLVMLDGAVLLAFEKREPVMLHDVPMFNLRIGATATTKAPDEKLVDMARRAQQTLGLRLVAVDIIELKTGEHLILEVNEGFSLEHYMRQSAEHKRLAEKVYEAIVEAAIPTKSERT